LDCTFEQEEVVVDLTVVGETSERGDVLLNSVSLASSVVLYSTLCAGTKTVDLVVQLGSVMVTILTSTGDRPFDGGWMPSSDTSNLSQTSVSLTWELLGAESGNDTLKSVTTGNTNCVDTFILLENLTELDLLLEVVEGELDFVSNASTVKLDFQNVSLVLAEFKESNLGSNKNADY
jgi:hypothetical protein